MGAVVSGLIVDPTPRLTEHARQRCLEMGVLTKRVKDILRRPTMTYVSRDGHIAWSAADPSIAVIYTDDGPVRVAITVVPRTYDDYVRSSK